MKYYWQISTFFLVLSAGLGVWIAGEVGLLNFGDAGAANEAKSTMESTDSTKVQEAIENKEIDVKRRERNLAEKEGILQEQITRYEKVIVDLRSKLESQEKEFKAKLADEKNGTAEKIKNLEEEVRGLKGNKDKEIAEVKKAKDQEIADLSKKKDSEIKALKDQIAKSIDDRAKTYLTIYEKMESKKAAKIFDEMELGLAAHILEGMKQDRAAEILGKMSAERARLITEKSHPKQGMQKKVSAQSSVGKEPERVAASSGTKDEAALDPISKGGDE